jgi:hypothetical protein
MLNLKDGSIRRPRFLDQFRIDNGYLHLTPPLSRTSAFGDFTPLEWKKDIYLFFYLFSFAN